jgi:hypothetical protein
MLWHGIHTPYNIILKVLKTFYILNLGGTKNWSNNKLFRCTVLTGHIILYYSVTIYVIIIYTGKWYLRVVHKNNRQLVKSHQVTQKGLGKESVHLPPCICP